MFSTLPAEGVRVLAAEQAPETLEGTAPHQLLVLAEFDSKERLQTWYESPAYQAVLQLRLDGTEGFALIAEGVPQG